MAVEGPPTETTSTFPTTDESTNSRDKSPKRDLYQRSGVLEYWIVDPEANTVKDFRLDAAGIYKSLGRYTDSIEFKTERLHTTVDLKKVW